MQLVNFETLKNLATELHEDDESAEKFSYNMFKQFTDKLASKYGSRAIHDDGIMQNVGIEIRKYLKTYVPPIKYVGMGSSRSAYACTGGKCLKVALNVRGIAQNKQEVANTINSIDGKDATSYDFLAKTYDYDGSNYLSLWTECCSEIDPGIFSRMYQCEFNVFTLDLEILMHDAIEDDTRFSKDEKENAKQSWIANMIANDEAFRKVFNSLFDFYKKNGKDALQFNDLHGSYNWGFGIRYGKIVPVIIDAGFSKEVQDKFYR